MDFAGCCLTMRYQVSMLRHVWHHLTGYNFSSFFFFSFLKKLSVSTPIVFEGIASSHDAFFIREWMRNETNDVDGRCTSWGWRGDVLTLRLALCLFSLLEGYLTMDAHWRGLKDLDLFTGNEYMTWLCFSLFFLFNFELQPYGLDGYPGLVIGSPLGFVLIFVFTASATYTFWDISSGKSRLSTVSGWQKYRAPDTDIHIC